MHNRMPDAPLFYAFLVWGLWKQWYSIKKSWSNCFRKKYV